MAAFPPAVSPSGFQIPEELNLFDMLIQSDLGDTDFRAIAWNLFKHYAPVGPINFYEITDAIEQLVSLNGKPLADNVDQLFQQFQETLTPIFEANKFPEEHLVISQVHLSALQERLKTRYEDQALEIIWDDPLRTLLEGLGAFENEPAPIGLKAIRSWLNNPDHAHWIQQITRLNLSKFDNDERSELNALPPEIGLFTGLESLDLSCNHISYLPDSIGNLRNLRMLNLSDNSLYCLPKSLGDLEALTSLSLNRNQLRRFPESVGNLNALKNLELSFNHLGYLPESVGNLKALEVLDLTKNRLRILPESIGDLPSLCWLSLSQNSLTSVPLSMSNLNRLQHLFLCNNNLVSLPNSLLKLPTLTKISLINNPLMFLHLEPLSNLSEKNELLRRLVAFENYIPQSPMASLVQAIGLGKSTIEVQEAYSHLSPAMQKQIESYVSSIPIFPPKWKTILSPIPLSLAGNPSSSSSLAPSQNFTAVFSDPTLFAKGVLGAIYAQFDQLSSKELCSVYHHVWDLAGRQATDDPRWVENSLLNSMIGNALYYIVGYPISAEGQWGKAHAFDHMLRFIDALEREKTS